MLATCTLPLLTGCASLPVQHVAEIPFETAHVAATRGVPEGQGTVTHLGQIGCLSRRLLAAHSVWVSPEEVRDDERHSICVSALMGTKGRGDIVSGDPLERYEGTGGRICVSCDGLRGFDESGHSQAWAACGDTFCCTSGLRLFSCVVHQASESSPLLSTSPPTPSVCCAAVFRLLSCTVHVHLGMQVGLMAEHRVSAVHCPAAAMRMLGFSPVAAMLQAGVNVSLGTDGAPSNNRMSMGESARGSRLAHAYPVLPWAQRGIPSHGPPLRRSLSQRFVLPPLPTALCSAMVLAPGAVPWCS